MWPSACALHLECTLKGKYVIRKYVIRNQLPMLCSIIIMQARCFFTIWFPCITGPFVPNFNCLLMPCADSTLKYVTVNAVVKLPLSILCAIVLSLFVRPSPHPFCCVFSKVAVTTFRFFSQSLFILIKLRKRVLWANSLMRKSGLRPYLLSCVISFFRISMKGPWKYRSWEQ